MYKRTHALLVLLLAAALVLTGCKKDAEINTVLADFNTFTNELVGKVDSASSPQSGLDAAQKYLDEKKPELRSKWNSIKSVKNFQVSAETKKRMEDVKSEVLLQLISRLNALKTEDDGRAIANFRSYVAVTTHNACHEFLRRKYPERWRLKNRLRYLLTHRSDFALWEGEEGDWLCGLEPARGQKKSCERRTHR